MLTTPDYNKANWDSFLLKLSTVTPPVLDRQKPAEIDNATTQLYDQIGNTTSELYRLKDIRK